MVCASHNAEHLRFQTSCACLYHHKDISRHVTSHLNLLPLTLKIEMCLHNTGTKLMMLLNEGNFTPQFKTTVNLSNQVTE